MESTKLHNVIFDAVQEETEIKLTEKINALITQIQQNQAPQIELTISEIKESLSFSIFNSYSVSNLKVLQEIRGVDFFGETAFHRIKTILELNSYNTAKIISELQEYVKSRNEFIATLTQIKVGFEKLEIPLHFTNEDYELGLLLPSKTEFNSIKGLNKELAKWDKSIKAYRELVGLGPEDTKITLVNNGSLEFFTENPEQVALCISFTLERLFKLYKNILEIRLAWNKLKDTGLPKTQEKAIKNHEKEIYEKEVDSIVADLIKKFADKKIEEGRLNELKISIKGHTNYFAKCIDDGLVIEITPPEVNEPEILNEVETEENKKEKAKAKSDFDAKIEKVKTIRDGLKAGKEIYSLGKEVFKMLTSGEEEKEGNEESTDEEKTDEK
jgi:hypothetical protein